MPKVVGICLCPFGIYLRESDGEITPGYVMHERIHWRQQVEMLIIPFYIWYGIEYLVRLPRWKDKAYHNISFEREAYINYIYSDYLSKRKPHAWTKYLKKSNK